MANRSGQTRQKRDKERARQQKQRDKAVRRLAVKQEKGQASPRRVGEEDPDIAGLRPGPQPLPAQWAGLAEEQSPLRSDDDGLGE